MPPERVFLDWNQPFLAAAAQYLLDREIATKGSIGSAEDPVDLSTIIVTLPTKRAGRELHYQLRRLAADRGLFLLVPAFCTIGELPELLIGSDAEPAAETAASTGADGAASDRLADAIEQQLAWEAAIAAAPLEVLCGENMSGLLPELPAGELPAAQRQQLAARCQQLWAEAAAAGLSFTSLAEEAAKFYDSRSHERWQKLEVLFEGYLQALSQVGLADRYSLRKQAVSQKRISANQRVVLAGVVEMPELTRRIISLLRDCTVLIFAPSSHEQGFNAYGDINPAYWVDTARQLQRPAFSVAEAPLQSARQLLDAFTREQSNFGTTSVALGYCSPDAVPALENQFRGAGHALRFAHGRPLGRTPVFSLLAAISKLVRQRKFASFCELVRHDDFSSWLGRVLPPVEGELEPQLALINSLDCFQSKHLQDRFPAPVAALNVEKKTVDISLLDSAQQAVLTLLSEFFTPAAGSGRKRDQLGAWAEKAIALLDEIYPAAGEAAAADVLISEADARVEEMLHVREVLEKIAARRVDELTGTSVSEALTGPFGSCTAAEALAFFASAFRSQFLAPRICADSIELLGWLELALDKSPCLLISGFNEGAVPESINSDSFLPNALRRRLGLADNDFRFARDIYLLQTMLHSKKRLEVFCCRRTAAGAPLLPSRLLLCGDAREAAASVLSFFIGEKQGCEPDGTASGGRTASRPQPLLRFEVATPLPEISTVSATAFRDYLDCPFLFYLCHVLRIDCQGDREREMDARLFGSLAHQVLYRFGRDEIAQPTVGEKEIRNKLAHLLETAAKRSFGSTPHPAVLVQLEQLKHRLAIFAVWQAKQTAAGWRIKAVEARFKEGEFALDLPNGKRLAVSGSIDRIDFHALTKQWIVYDYKTSDAANDPARTHFCKKRGWIDLQLPIYRRYAREVLKFGPDIQCGYLNLSKEDSGVCSKIACWSDDDYQQAQQALISAAVGISEGRFSEINLDGNLPLRFPTIFGEDMAELLTADEIDEDEEGND